MSVTRFSGRSSTYPLPYKASTALAANACVTFDGSGNIVATAATSAATAVVDGVTIKARAASDSDYASITYYPCELPFNDLFLVDCTTGKTVAQANVGVAYEIAGNGTTITTDATTHPSFVVVGFTDSTHAICKLKTRDSVEPV